MGPPTHDRFKVAIICALPLEADAVEAHFDKTYPKFDNAHGGQHGDENTYITGRIGHHDVVLCCLPRMGIAPAASATANLCRTYPRIQLALVVGVCGGVPLPSDNIEIILGDVIISDSLIQYDFGRQYPDQFRRKKDLKDALGRPNAKISGLLRALEGRKTRIEFEERVYRHLVTLQGQEKDNTWQYPGVQYDVLFEASYRHRHYPSQARRNHLKCFECELNNSVCDVALKTDCRSLGCAGTPVLRSRHNSEIIKPLVFIGRMASANTVMKSGEDRDRWAAQEEVIGFEMEGAGVWDNIPCMVIKGVCDYADSHKDKKWQPYSAATAASAAKALLELWKPTLTETPAAPPDVEKLFGAVKLGDLPLVRHFLESIDVDARRARDGRTALSMAAEIGNCEIAKVLLDHGASVESHQYTRSCIDVNRGRDWGVGRTPLIWAASCRHYAMVQLLLDHQADPNSENSAGRTALHSACMLGDQRMARLLLTRGANVDFVSRHHGWGAVHEAALNNYIGIMRLLIKNNASLNVNVRVSGMNSHGKAPLHFAVDRRSLEIMSLLLESGADPDIKMIEDITPLHLAAASGWVDGIELLLEHKAFIDPVDSLLKETPLHKAARNRKHEAYNQLCKLGADTEKLTIDSLDGQGIMELAQQYPDDWGVPEDLGYFLT